MPSVSTVIFDLDGTLVDSHPGIARAFTQAMSEVLPSREVPDFTRFIGPPVREVFRKSLNCGDGDSELLDVLNAAFRRHYDGVCWRETFPYDGTEGLLQRLTGAGVVCHVLTNKPALATGRILEESGLAKYFGCVISPDSVTPAFPCKTTAARHLLKTPGFDPAGTWLLGDSLDDAAAAAAVGCFFGAVAYGYGAAASQSLHPVHAVLSHPDDFPVHMPFNPHPATS